MRRMHGSRMTIVGLATAMAGVFMGTVQASSLSPGAPLINGPYLSNRAPQAGVGPASSVAGPTSGESPQQVDACYQQTEIYPPDPPSLQIQYSEYFYCQTGAPPMPSITVQACFQAYARVPGQPGRWGSPEGCTTPHTVEDAYAAIVEGEYDVNSGTYRAYGEWRYTPPLGWSCSPCSGSGISGTIIVT